MMILDLMGAWTNRWPSRSPVPAPASGVLNGRGDGESSSLMLPLAPGAINCGKPPLSSSGARQKRRYHEHAHSENIAGSKYGANGGRCHCSKCMKHRVKRTIRVPAITPKVADIPADEDEDEMAAGGSEDDESKEELALFRFFFGRRNKKKE